jgi:uncharacterized tellurite resistance protein B-like protein
MRNLPGLLSRLTAFWAGSAESGAGRTDDEERRLAAAALLVEAARQDGDYAPEERALIRALLSGRFGLSGEEADALLAGAEEAQRQATDLFRFTRQAVAGLDEEGRQTLIEMLWQVVLADGRLDDYEASLMRRVAGLLHVSDHASAAARHRALERLKTGSSG